MSATPTAAATAAPCAPGYRDDNYIIFQSKLTNFDCALNQPAHYALICVWFATVAFALVEFLLAQVRKTDKSPTSVRVSYFVWVAWGWLNYVYVITHPYASVVDPYDAGFILFAVAMRMGASSWLSVMIQRHLIITGAQSVSLQGSKTHNEEGAKHVFTTLSNLSNRFLLPQTAVYIVVMFVLVGIVPTILVSGSFNTPLPVLENLLMGGWIASIYIGTLSPIGVAYVTYHVRHVVIESIRFSRKRARIAQGNAEKGGEVDSGSGSAGGKDESTGNSGSNHKDAKQISGSKDTGSGNGSKSNGSKGNHNTKSSTSSDLDSRMTDLMKRLTANVIISSVIALFNVLLLIGAAMVGYQYWIFHVHQAQATLHIILQLNYYRGSFWQSFTWSSTSDTNGAVSNNSSLPSYQNGTPMGSPRPAVGELTEIMGSDDQDQTVVSSKTPSSVRIGNVMIDMDVLNAVSNTNTNDAAEAQDAPNDPNDVPDV